MSIESLEPLRSEAFTDQQQAAFFHSRERRRSLAGVPELFRTHVLRGVSGFPTAGIATGDIFPDRERPITFQTAIRFTAASPSGLLTELGGLVIGLAVWIGTQTIGIRAGGAVTAGDEAFATFDNGSEWPTGLELDLTFASVPDGSVALWANGKQLISTSSANANYGGNPWAGAETGSFASGPAATIPPDVPINTAPSGFIPIEPLSAYNGQLPRQFPR